MFVFFRAVGGREGVVDDSSQARKAENTDPCTNYAVKYALRLSDPTGILPP